MAQGWLQIAIFIAVLVALTKPVGVYMARVFANQRVFLTPSSGRSSASPTRCCASGPSRRARIGRRTRAA